MRGLFLYAYIVSVSPLYGGLEALARGQLVARSGGAVNASGRLAQPWRATPSPALLLRFAAPTRGRMAAATSATGTSEDSDMAPGASSWQTEPAMRVHSVTDCALEWV